MRTRTSEIFACVFILDICNVSQAFANQSFMIENYVLQDSTYIRIEAFSLSTCIEACSKDTRCVSINFAPRGCCELNDRGVSDKSQCGGSLVFSPGCVYRQLKSSYNTTEKVNYQYFLSLQLTPFLYYNVHFFLLSELIGRQPMLSGSV